MRPLVPAVVVLALCRCTCQEALTELIPDIDVDDAPRALSRQIVGAPVAVDVQVGNRGTGVLDLRPRVEPADQGFVIGDAPDQIRPQQAADVALTFTPPARGPFAATLVLEGNDPDEPEVRIALTGEGGPPILDVSPTSVDFGLVNEGDNAERVVTVSNIGFDALTGLGAALDVGSAYTAVTSALPASLAPQESAVVLLHLTPDAATAALEDVDGLLRDALVVTWAEGEARVPVVGSVNLAPVAVAVEKLTRAEVVKVGVGKPLLIDGTETTDPEGDAFSFSWTLLERPPGSFAALVGATEPEVRITADEIGTYTIELRATDVHGASGTDTVTLLPRDLSVVLRWSTDASAACTAFDEAACAALPANERDDVCCGQSDLDLHVIRPGGALGDAGTCPGGCDTAQCTEAGEENLASCRQLGTDCAWNNRAPEWGEAGRADDPRLDVDDVRGDGPEVTSLDLPVDGAYRAIVHYCTDRIGEPTLARVEVYVEGVLTESTGPALLQQGDAWTATTMLRANGAWTFVSPPGVVDAAPAGLCAP